MTTQLAPPPVQRFYDNAGNLAVGGLLYTYQSGTTTPQATYTDNSGSTPNTNPIVLNARGECQIWLDPSLVYKLVLQDSSANVLWTVDNIQQQIGASAAMTPVVNAATLALARTAMGITPANIGAAPRATRIDVASVAGTVDLTANAPNTDDIRITGALAITGFTVASDRVLRVTAGGAFTLTNGAGLVTQTGANIVATAGDTFMLRATSANVVEVLEYSYAGIVPPQSITPAKLAQPLTLGTAVPTTSGTAIDFTGIPSWVKRITLMFSGVSLSGSAHYLVQLGSGSPQTTGYVGTSSAVSSTVVNTTTGINGITSGMVIYAANAAIAVSGSIVLNLVGSNVWVSSHALGGSSDTRQGGGVVTLSGTLDRVRLTTSTGTDTFDAGSVNILYEG